MKEKDKNSSHEFNRIKVWNKLIKE